MWVFWGLDIFLIPALIKCGGVVSRQRWEEAAEEEEEEVEERGEVFLLCLQSPTPVRWREVVCL